MLPNYSIKIILFSLCCEYTIFCVLFQGGLDLILMPGLGFTKHGDRIGRGKGYYDSYLLKYKEALDRIPSTVALAFYEQICDHIPTSEHDVPVDKVIYEDKRKV